MQVFVSPTHKITGVLQVPASKPHMQRALIFALLSEGETIIHNPSWSSETQRLFEAEQLLGMVVLKNEKDILILKGTGGHFRSSDSYLKTDGSGFMFRMMAALACTQSNEMVIEGHLSIKQRPVLQHLSFINDLGGSIHELSNSECVQLKISGNAEFGGETVVDTAQTSQFLTALLLIGPLSKDYLTLKTVGSKRVGEGYIDLTLDMMKERGVTVEKTGTTYNIPRAQYNIIPTEIPSDFTAVSYILAAVIVLPGSKVSIAKYRPSTMSCEQEVFDAFSLLGAKTNYDKVSKTLHIRHEKVDSTDVEIDGANIPSVIPALCAAACFADTNVMLKNASHVNLHKCQRLLVTVEQLKKMGCNIEVSFNQYGTMDGFLAIGKSTPIGGVVLETYGDHRVLGGLFAAALGACENVTINGVENMGAGYPEFFAQIANAGAQFTIQKTGDMNADYLGFLQKSPMGQNHPSENKMSDNVC